MKLIIILGIIVLALIPGGIWVFAGIFCALIYYTYRKQIQNKIYEQNEFDETILEEMK